MALERTLAIVKPDGVRRGYTSPIRERYVLLGLQVVDIWQDTFDHRFAEQFYLEHREKDFFFELVLAMTCGPSRFYVLEGENAVARLREINGATKAEEQKPGTIRKDFRSAGGPFNVVHGSDSVASFEREYAIVISMRETPPR